MPGLHIGKLSPDEVVKDEDMKKDFIELRKTAEQMVCDGRVFLPFAYILQAYSYVYCLGFVYKTMGL